LLIGQGFFKLPVYISGSTTDPSLFKQMGKPKEHTIKTDKCINKNKKVNQTYN
jgi:hypothetical protein